MGRRLERLEKNRQKKAKRKTRRLIIILIIAIIGTAIAVLYKLDLDYQILGGNFASIFSIVEKKSTMTEEQRRENAIKLAINKFKELGEEVEARELNVIKIERNGEYYYYISAEENSLEVKTDTQEITRINGVLLDD